MAKQITLPIYAVVKSTGQIVSKEEIIRLFKEKDKAAKGKNPRTGQAAG